jgi:NADH pyrophosphatase NudC (nudix superfamily)
MLSKFKYCPICGSSLFNISSEKSRKCGDCGFEYFVNPSSANVAFILNEKGELLVERRKNNPAKGTLDLPGGFADMNETVEEGLIREVMEETGLEVTEATYMFSKPNTYHYSGVDIPTLDMFFRCKVKDDNKVKANDDAAECMWIPLEEIETEQFGLNSVRSGLIDFIKIHNNTL